MSYPGTARDHLDWSITRAMEYADMGDMAGAWASFLSDTAKHEGTAHLATHELMGMAMVSGLYKTPAAFREFITGFSVRNDQVTS